MWVGQCWDTMGRQTFSVSTCAFLFPQTLPTEQETEQTTFQEEQELSGVPEPSLDRRLLPTSGKKRRRKGTFPPWADIVRQWMGGKDLLTLEQTPRLELVSNETPAARQTRTDSLSSLTVQTCVALNMLPKRSRLANEPSSYHRQ